MDIILYGYGFNDHWMWDNSYKLNEGYSVSFIIWKDYNCIKWVSFSQNGISPSSVQKSYSEDIAGIIMQIIFNPGQDLHMNEVWKSAQAIVNQLNSNSTVSQHLATDRAFTVILSQSAYTIFNLRACFKDYILANNQPGSFGGKDADGGTWGTAFVMQMR